DYAVPRADDLPSFTTDQTVTPTPHNPMGAKGIGEAATIGSTPAIVNAVVDALRRFVVRHLNMALRPEGIWQAIRRRAGDGRGRAAGRLLAGPVGRRAAGRQRGAPTAGVVSIRRPRANARRQRRGGRRSGTRRPFRRARNSRPGSWRDTAGGTPRRRGTRARRRSRW